jgi:hypothetical protein
MHSRYREEKAKTANERAQQVKHDGYCECSWKLAKSHFTITNQVDAESLNIINSLKTT